MFTTFQPTLRWIADQQQEMIRLLIEWANINSGTYNIEGLNLMAAELMQAFSTLGTEIQYVTLPNHSVVNADGELTSHPLGSALRLKNIPMPPCKFFFLAIWIRFFRLAVPSKKRNGSTPPHYEGPEWLI